MELQKDAFYRFKIQGWKDRVAGRVLAQDDQWILLHYNPMQYLLDGFKLLKKDHIESAKRGKGSLRRERVAQLKGIEVPDHWGALDTSSTLSLLRSVQNTFGLLQFEDSDDEILIGKLKMVANDTFNIDFLDSKGRWTTDYDEVFSLSSIDVITFETDYLKSLKLLAGMVKDPV